MNIDQKLALLAPIIERCYTGHCWIKTADGPRWIDQPFDAIKAREHAAGTKSYGLCPIAPGTSTTRLAVLDLDSHKGETPFDRMREIADEIMTVMWLDGLEPLAFRSSGGRGIHIYTLWDDAQDAYSVREAMREVLTACKYRPGTGGVARGEVEVYPKQNEVPTGEYGSMFILPFAGQSVLL